MTDSSPSPPDLPYELGDLPPTQSAHTESQSAGQGLTIPTTPPPNPALRNGQRVRFNPSDIERSPPEGRSTSRDRSKYLSSPALLGSPGVARPRPALSRNPSSYNSVLDNIPDLPLSPEKEKSAAEAARRARAVAADAKRHSEPAPGYEYSGRWSPESEAITEGSFSNEPLTAGHNDHRQSTATTTTQAHGELDNQTEARELLRAHYQYQGPQEHNKRISGTCSAITLL